MKDVSNNPFNESSMSQRTLVFICVRVAMIKIVALQFVWLFGRKGTTFPLMHQNGAGIYKGRRDLSCFKSQK